MKKIRTILNALFFFWGYLSLLPEARGQDTMSTLLRSELTNFDKRKVIGSAFFVKGRTIGDLGFQTDGRNILSFSTGLTLLDTADHFIWLAVVPGVAVNYKDGRSFVSLAVYCKKEEERLEIFLRTKCLRSLSGLRTLKFIIEGDALIGGRFKLGPQFSIEGEKKRLTPETAYYEYIHLLAVKFKWEPQKSHSKFFFSGSVGYQSEKEEITKTFFPYKEGPHTTRGFAYFIGLILLL